MLDLEPWKRPIAHYFRWLKRVDPDLASKYADRLRVADDDLLEGAVGEAIIWNVLEDRGVSVAPAEGPNGGPDFVASVGGSRFYVEATNISRHSVERATRLPIQIAGTTWAFSYAPITKRLKSEIADKAAQFKDSNLDFPLLVAVTTLHPHASSLVHRCHVEELLLGQTGFGWRVNLVTGQAEDTVFPTASFVHSSATLNRTLETSRHHVSAILFGCFARFPSQYEMRGVLMPAPTYVFDHSALSDVEFCRFRRWPPEQTKTVETEWLNPVLERPRRPVDHELHARITRLAERTKEQD